MRPAEYLTWSLLSGCGALASGQILLAAEHYGNRAQAWLSGTAFGLWSALAAVCFWGAL